MLGVMPKRSSSDDPNVAAFRAVQKATGQRKPRKNPAAVALGRLGGKVGGKARAEALSPKQRQEIARKAAQARWKDKGK